MHSLRTIVNAKMFTPVSSVVTRVLLVWAPKGPIVLERSRQPSQVLKLDPLHLPGTSA